MTIKDDAKTILCFGDSNTWGANLKDGSRYPRSVRWPSVLQTLLGENYEVINEGLSGRTFVACDPQKTYRTGITHLIPILKTHDPADWIVIMLGTNDVKANHNLNAEDISTHLEQTIQLTQDNNINLKRTPKIIIVCPPSPVTPDSGKIDPRMTRAPEIFKALPSLYKQVSERYHCDYLNAGDYISSSKIDGYHLDADAHLKLAEVIAKRVKNLCASQTIKQHPRTN